MTPAEETAGNPSPGFHPDAGKNDAVPPPQRGRAAVFWIFALMVLFLALQPTSRAPLKDEGGYYRMTIDFPAYGLDVYKTFDMTSTSLTLITGCYIATVLGGKTLFVARGFVLLVCVASLLLSYALLRRTGETPRILLLFLGLIALNPLFSRYAHTFTTDGVFTALCLLSLCFYAAGLQGNRRTDLLAGSVTAALAIYTRQPGIILPVVPLALLFLRTVKRKELPDLWAVPILLLPYAAFAPLALFFHSHSGSYLVYVSKPWEHGFTLCNVNVLLWSVNFIGFFSAPFCYHLIRGHGSLLTSFRKAPLVLCLLLSGLILLGSTTLASNLGGLGRIFSTLHLPGVLVGAIVVVCQFLGLATLAILGLRALSGSLTDGVFLLFTLLYMAGMSTKGGNILVHYAAPLILPAAWACATACRREYPGSRKFFLLCLFAFGLFGTVWSKAESELGNSIHTALQYLEEAREPGDRTLTWSATALQLVGRERLTFSLEEADNGLITPEDPYPISLTEQFRIVKEIPATLFGRSLGRVTVFQRTSGQAAAPEENGRDR